MMIPIILSQHMRAFFKGPELNLLFMPERLCFGHCGFLLFLLF